MNRECIGTGYSYSKYVFMIITGTILIVLLILPMVAIFFEAFRDGITIFYETIILEHTLVAIRLSIVITAVSVIASTIFGICVAWCITHFRFPCRKILLSLIDVPISISPIIIGLMFVLIYGKYGYLGTHLEKAGIVIIFSWPGLLLTNMSITMPYVARSLIPVMQELSSQQEEVGHMLGANGLYIFWRITLPRIKWALLYGIILATARGAGEFGAASVVSGLIRKKTVTLPLQIDIFYSEYLSTSAFVCATLFVLLSVFSLLAKYVVEKKRLAL